jgi:hypothetical protein
MKICINQIDRRVVIKIKIILRYDKCNTKISSTKEIAKKVV